MILAALLLMTSGAEAPAIVDRLEDDAVARAGIVAELLERPVESDRSAFAQRVVDAEGLQPWGGPDQGITAHGLHYISVHAGDGRNVVVYFLPPEGREARNRACRIRSERTGHSDARWRAFRWCHSAFGLQTPQASPPPITGIIAER